MAQDFTRWWFQPTPIEKYARQNGWFIFPPNVRGETSPKNIGKLPPPSILETTTRLFEQKLRRPRTVAGKEPLERLEDNLHTYSGGDPQRFKG